MKRVKAEWEDEGFASAEDACFNLLMNMTSVLSPDSLTHDEVKLLEKKYGQEWFHKLGYRETGYERSIHES